MPPKLQKPCDAGYCLYAANTLLPLINQLSGELEGVKSADDIEYIHRCRVATRRIRAALSLFGCCFPKRAKQWRKEVQALTKALGDARDRDVQIAFVRDYMDSHTGDERSVPALFSPETPAYLPWTGERTAIILQEKKRRTPRFQFFREQAGDLIRRIRKIGREKHQESEMPRPGGEAPPAPIRPGLECLLLRLTQGREEVQPEVTEAVCQVEESGLIEDMRECLNEAIVRANLEEANVLTPFTDEQTFIRIMTSLNELFWFEQFLTDPEQVSQHHAMRIAAKHLRYTLEAYADLFTDSLKKEMKAVKHLQDLLGEMHDCDVWITFLPGFLEEEKIRSQTYFGNPAFFNLIEPGIKDLIASRITERERLHKETLAYWSQLKISGIWNGLEEKVSRKVQRLFEGLSAPEKEGTLKIAIIGDVHANLPALEAVLADAQMRGVSAVINAGDSIGYGAFPNEVIDLLRNRHVLSVLGNYDLSVLSKIWKEGRPKNRGKRKAMHWAYEHTSHENRIYLINLPKEVRLTIRGIRILVTHGSPDSMTEYIVEETPQSRLNELAEKTGADIIISGHSHRPFSRETDGIWFVNTGSVGRPEDGDPRACYAILTFDPFSISHIRVHYDIERAVSAIHENNLPETFARIIREGRSLDVLGGDDEKTT